MQGLIKNKKWVFYSIRDGKKEANSTYVMLKRKINEENKTLYT
jgi:hypothetical protein